MTDTKETNFDVIVEGALQDWATKNNPEAIRQRIHTTLDNHLTEIISQTMGFKRDRWGSRDEWEVDHCNGVQKYTAIGQMVTANADAVVKEWLAGLKVTLDDIPKGLEKAYKKSVFEQMQRDIAYSVRDTVNNLANELAAKMVGELDLNAIPFKDEDNEDDEWDDDFEDDDDDDDDDDPDMSNVKNWRV